MFSQSPLTQKIIYHGSVAQAVNRSKKEQATKLQKEMEAQEGYGQPNNPVPAFPIEGIPGEQNGPLIFSQNKQLSANLHPEGIVPAENVHPVAQDPVIVSNKKKRNCVIL